MPALNFEDQPFGADGILLWVVMKTGLRYFVAQRDTVKVCDATAVEILDIVRYIKRKNPVH